jgi:hypothetical protein
MFWHSVEIKDLSFSSSYFKFEPDSRSSATSLRIACLIGLIRVAALLPIALFLKCLNTLGRFLGVVSSIGALCLTFGLSESVRLFFLRRMRAMADDLADWVLLPIALVVWALKLIMALLISPALFFL